VSDNGKPLREATPAGIAAAPGDHPSPGGDGGEAPHAVRRRGGEGARRVADPRTVIIRYRATPSERDATVSAAADAGLSLGAFVRQQTVGTAGPRAKRRPALDHVMLGRLLGALGKSGGNLNQIAHRFNRDEHADLPELYDALVEHRACVAAIMGALLGA
jgi:hypothetical protein